MVSILQSNRQPEPEILWPTALEFKAALRGRGLDHPWFCDSETDGLQVRGPNSPNKAWYVGLNPYGTNTVYCFDTREPAWAEVKPEVERLYLVGHNLRFDIHALDLEPRQLWGDSMACAYRNGTTLKKSLDHYAKILGWKKIPTPPELKGPKGGSNSIHLVPREDIARYMADDILCTAALWDYHDPGRQQVSLDCLDPEVEYACFQMERRGVRLLTDRLEALSAELAPLIAQHEQVIRSAGFQGNLSSPSQLLSWLHEKGYRQLESTNSKVVLEPYAEKTGDPLISAIVNYRKSLKLRKDFCLTLPNWVQSDGLIHATVNTMRTSTTRFSYQDPNLQQIPKHGEVAKKFRRCFTGASGWYSGADFSQVEYRVAAALSGEAVLLEAFESGQDMHTTTAAAANGVRYEDVTPEQRFAAKALNFGYLNGMRPKRLAVQLRCSYQEAREFYDKHRAGLPALTDWMEETWDDARATGQMRTLEGALVSLPRDSRGEYAGAISAVSMKVQGGAAALLRRALVAAEQGGFKTILAVHDELGVDGKDQHQELAECMTAAANAAFPDLLGSVDFKAEGWSGDSWAEE